MGHVKKGCLARPRDDIRSDGSRIEGAHKGWNGLQRSFASGIKTITSLGHDFVLRRNTRIEFSGPNPSPFVASSAGSHHLRLVNVCAVLWNKLISSAQATSRALPADIHPLPEIIVIDSGETFGLTEMSLTTASHYALATIKTEESDADELLDLSSQSLLDASHILEELGVPANYLHRPLLIGDHDQHPAQGELSDLGLGVAPAAATDSSLVSYNIYRCCFDSDLTTLCIGTSEQATL